MLHDTEYPCQIHRKLNAKTEIPLNKIRIFFNFVVAAAVAHNIHSCELDTFSKGNEEEMRANCVFPHKYAYIPIRHRLYHTSKACM